MNVEKFDERSGFSFTFAAKIYQKSTQYFYEPVQVLQDSSNEWNWPFESFAGIEVDKSL